jgi:hypothetical protein
MGALDDAIREHLELKRRHGASEQEISQAEAEALGPARRTPAGAAGAGAGEPTLDETGMPAPAEAFEAPPMPGEAVADAAPPPMADDAVVDAPPPPSVDETPIEEPPVEEPPIEEPPIEEPPVEEPPVEEPPVEPPPVEPPPVEEPPLDDPDRTRTAILDDPLADPPAVHHEPGLDEPPAPALPQGAAAPEPAEEDVLEETPDFLQETPEHDRLWFEQKPPRDFDFD